MNEKFEKLEQIETENFIWIVYLFIIGISFVANHYEKEYYENCDEEAKKRYQTINIFIFGLALLIYIYFFKENYKTVQNLTCYDSATKIKFNELNFIASLLIVIAGSILLYIAIFDDDLETEISFS